MKEQKKPFFYGWIIVIAGVVVTGGSVGVVNNSLSAFVTPVCNALGFQRGEFTLYNSIMSVTGLIMLPIYGELFRRMDMKKIMLLCALLLGIVPWGYSFSTQLWQFYLLAALHGTLMQGVCFMAVPTIINNWFKQKKGLATGIAMAGTGLGGAVMVPIVTQVIGRFGWQWGYRLTGTAALCLLLPTILFVIKIKPADMGLLPLGAEESAQNGAAWQEPAMGFTRAEMLRMPSFYFIMVGLFFTCLVGGSMQTHAMSYFTDIGYESRVASGFISLNMAALMAGKIILGLVFDRFGIMVGCFSAAGSLAFAAFLHGFAAIPACAALAVCFQAYGFSCGSVASSVIATRYFGNKEFSRVFSTLSLASSSSGIFGMPYPGYVYDITGSYTLAWQLNIGIALSTFLLYVLAQRSNNRAWSELEEAETAQAAP